jgi:6-phosphogluconolactonase
MKTTFRKSYTLLSLVPLLLFIASPVLAAPSGSHSADAGSVFTMTNSPSGNSILAYDRSASGALSFAGSFSTGSLGASGLTGSNQGGLVLSQDGSWLFAVNAGSNDISVFQVSQSPSTGLTLTDKVSSDGVSPISATIFGSWVYVLNAGTTTVAGNIAGFSLSGSGTLAPISGSVQPLSGITAPAQISFNPSGSVLIVTEKSTNLIDSYTLSSNGAASGPTTTPSNGGTPFGFAFDNKGNLIVSDASSGALSSYTVSDSGSVTTVSGTVTDGQLAPCWVVVTGNGKLAFTTNAHSNTISSYSIDHKGTLSVLQSIAASTDKTDTDMALSGNSHFLYVYDAGAHEIQGFAVHSDGTLTWIQTVSGIPAGADGLAAN